VADCWGRLQGFAQLGIPKRGLTAVGRYPSLLLVAETELNVMGGRAKSDPPLGE
jgi:hypothetical protein